MQKGLSFFISNLIVQLSFILFVSCSSTETTTTKKQVTQGENTAYPTWYRTGETVQTSDTHYIVHTAAIGSDSVTAIAKALEKGKAALEAGVSERIEKARKDIANQNSSAGSPEFLIALRNAESSISGDVKRSNATVRRVKGYSSYRGYVEVRISKTALKELMDSRLSDFQTIWSSLKTNL